MKKKQEQIYKTATSKEVIKAMEECTKKYEIALSNLSKK